MNDQPPTIYLLDDEPGMVKALTRLLRTEGFSVEGFTSPGAFLKAFQPGGRSCLILDVAMPEIDGLAFQQTLKQRGIRVPVIFLTGHGDVPMCVRAMRAGAVDFLTKPVNDVELLRAITAALSPPEENG